MDQGDGSALPHRAARWELCNHPRPGLKQIGNHSGFPRGAGIKENRDFYLWWEATLEEMGLIRVSLRLPLWFFPYLDNN